MTHVNSKGQFTKKNPTCLPLSTAIYSSKLIQCELPRFGEVCLLLNIMKLDSTRPTMLKALKNIHLKNSRRPHYHWGRLTWFTQRELITTSCDAKQRRRADLRKKLLWSDGHSTRNSITVAERRQPETVTPPVSHFQMYTHLCVHTHIQSLA